MTAVRGPAHVRDPLPGGRSVKEGEQLSHPLAIPAAGLAAIAVLTPAHGSWAAQLLMVPLLLVIPGVILLRTLRVPGAAIAANCVYVPAASLLVLTGSGLAIDLIGPLAGISAPLRAAPLLATLEVVCIGLLVAARNAPPETQIPWSALERPVALVWPIVLPLVGAAGALRLNSGHSNLIALISIILVIITLVVTFLRAPWCDDALLIVILFAAGLALMWSYSLRGDLVYGFDISNEYYSLTQTVNAGVWHFSHPNDAYSAMLSLTVLPAELHELSGVQTLLIFKVVFPVIGALFPVGVFCIARRLLARRWAFMAAFLIIMQHTFFQEFTALARQEVATLLFVALIAAILDTGQSPRSRWVFGCLLSLGMVVSHYSTAYLAIPLLAIAAVAQWVRSWFKPIPRATGAVLLALVVSVAGSAVWYGSLTHSTSNLSQFMQLADGQGLNLLPTSSSGNLLSSYLNGNQAPELPPAEYQKYVSSYYKTNFPFVTPLPDAADPQYALTASGTDPTPSVKLNPISSGLKLVNLLVQQLAYLLAGIGALILALRRRQKPIASQIGFLGLGGMVILVLTQLSGTVAQVYNQQRAFLQLLIVLGIIIAWFFQWIGSKYKWTRPLILASCSAALGLFLVGSTGLSIAVLGGGTEANLADEFSDYRSFVANSQDLAGAAWVAGEIQPNQIIEADQWGELRLETVVGNRPAMFDDITPETTDAHAWVYATRANVIHNITESQTGNAFGSYAFPKLFLDSNFNVVYTNGTSEVFHR
jgi:uncharacterized membrane protein